jgi:hypothetical protein
MEFNRLHRTLGGKSRWAVGAPIDEQSAANRLDCHDRSVRRGRSPDAYPIAGVSIQGWEKPAISITLQGGGQMNSGLTADAMYRESLLIELRQVELAVTNGERQLAEQERLLVSLKRQKENLGQAEAALELLRENQLRNEQDRQRLLSLLQR